MTAAIAAGVVCSLIPQPPDSDLLSLYAQLFILTAIGPLTLAWSWGPHPLNGLAVAVALVVPAAAILLLSLGYLRRGSRAALWTAAALWAGMGGYSSWVAATGSI